MAGYVVLVLYVVVIKLVVIIRYCGIEYWVISKTISVEIPNLKMSTNIYYFVLELWAMKSLTKNYKKSINRYTYIVSVDQRLFQCGNEKIWKSDDQLLASEFCRIPRYTYVSKYIYY